MGRLPGLPPALLYSKEVAFLTQLERTMKSGLKKVLSIGTAVLAIHHISRADENPVLVTATNTTEKLSYSVGINIGNSLKRAGFEVDPRIIGEAIRDVLSGGELKLTEQQAQETINAYNQELQAKRQQERLKLAEKNHLAAEKFLAANKQKSGIKIQEVKLAEGSTAQLQYKVIAEGTGAAPKPEDNVTFNYRFTTLDGKEIDSSVKRGQPTKTVLSSFPIRGVKEALQQMKVGEKRELFIPPSLAFEDRGAGANVEPGAAIIFEVELVSFEAPQAPQPLTSDIIKVPSKEELDKGAKIEVIKPEDVKRMQMQQQSNSPAAGKK
jgi:FKBP-type peptidyl-prolyl cis-trans isomerase FklB